MADSAPSPAIVVTAATLGDIPDLLDVYYSAFGSEDMLAIFPGTPEGRDFMAQWYRESIESKPGTQQSRVFVVKENGRSVASALWYLIAPEDGGCWHWRKRLPALREGMSESKLDDFFNLMEPQQLQTAGLKPRLFLNVLCTHEAYRKKGYGAALIEKGNEIADDLDYPCYLDAGTAAKPLYERLGYVVNPETEQKGPWAMYRKNKTDRLSDQL